MKYLTATIALTLALASAVLSQTNSNHGLILTGSVISVNPIFDYGSRESDRHVYKVDLYLQFKNETAKPLIIFRPEGFFGKKKVVFLDGFSSKADSEQALAVPPWVQVYRVDYDPFPSFLRELAATEPPKYEFVIIAPGGYHECRETLTVQKGYKLERTPKQKKHEGTAVPEYPELTVEYHLSLKDRHSDRDALEIAKRKWRQFSELVLDSDGDYTVKSEVILNKP